MSRRKSDTETQRTLQCVLSVSLCLCVKGTPYDRDFDALVVGAGPTGLACGIELQNRGVKTVLVEKGCVVNSIYHYPTNMTFFTTPELLEIGNIPMTSLNDKPNRNEALKYYRRVADHYRLDVRQYERVDRIDGARQCLPGLHHRPPRLSPHLQRAQGRARHRLLRRS